MRAYAIAFVLLSTAAAGRAAGQTPPAPAAQPPAAQPPAPEQTARPPAEAGEAYSYRPDGRRDPFVNLLGSGAEPRQEGRRSEGAASLLVAEISVRGIMLSKGALVAMVSGPDKKTYIVRQGDRFLDGRIKTVTPQGLIIIQEVNDPLSLVKQREIRKLLRSLEDGKA